MTQQELLTKTDYAAIGAEMSHEKASDFIKAYEKSTPQGIGGYSIGRNILDRILAQPGCVGIRFHYGLNDAGQKTLVYIGMDANGNDLVKQTVVMASGVMMTENAIVADFLQVDLGIFWPFNR